MAPKILIGKNASDVAEHLGNQILESLQARPNIIVGLSGGSLPKFLVQAVETHLKGRVDWSKVTFIFCDERLVPFDNPDSTYKLFKESLVDKQVEGITEANFVTIDPNLNVEDAAKDYEQKLRKESADAWPNYDILLLGMGPDGHTCSLFPGHPLLEEKSRWVAPISDSPKPPPCRITLTYPVLNNAKRCVFVCTGDGKKDVVKEIIEDGKDYPASRVRPDQHTGQLVWILDEPAASKLVQKQ